MNFNMWNHRSDLIESGPNLFDIYTLVDLTSEYIDNDIAFTTLILIAMEFIKCALGCDVILSIDIYNQHILWTCVRSWLLDDEFGIVSMT